MDFKGVAIKGVELAMRKKTGLDGLSEAEVIEGVEEDLAAPTLWLEAGIGAVSVSIASRQSRGSRPFPVRSGTEAALSSLQVARCLRLQCHRMFFRCCNHVHSRC
jgi:hypothetical protein